VHSEASGATLAPASTRASGPPQRRLGRWLLVTLGALALAAAAGAAVLESGLLEIPTAELEARYRLPQSQFAELEGVRVHYVDEGSGPPVLLIHASFMSLRTWDAAAEALSRTHRVIRFDRVGLGLSGTDPTGAYSRDRDMQIIDALLAKLGVDRVAIVGTSSGGGVAFHYAAAQPDRVTKLVLVNSGGLPRTPATDPNRPRGTALSRWVEERYKSRGWWHEQLQLQFANGQPPDGFVQQVYDMNRSEGQREIAKATRANFRTGDPERVLGQVRAPTLVIWGKKNITLSHLEADVFQHWITGAPTAVLKYPEAGHYAYLEVPEQFAKDVSAFLDGTMQTSGPTAPCVGGAPAPAAPVKATG
jgi:pimeloyl-ACP methyl ester carboxylesterase